MGRKKNCGPIVKVDDRSRKGSVCHSAVLDADRLRVFGEIRPGKEVRVQALEGSEWQEAAGEVIFVHPGGRFFTIRRPFSGPWGGRAYNESFPMPGRAGRDRREGMDDDSGKTHTVPVLAGCEGPGAHGGL